MTDSIQHGERLEQGAVLPGEIEQIAKELNLPFCDVVGFGELAWVELETLSGGAGRRFQGPFQLLDLKGRLRLAGDVVLADFVCTLARETDNGIALLGGKLVRAETRFVELRFSSLSDSEAISDSLGDVVLEQRETPPEQPQTLPLSTGSENRWAGAIAESERVQQEAKDLLDEELDMNPVANDIVHHRQFGQCTVLRVGDDHITLRKPDKRTVQLGLPILQFSRVGEQDGHTVFRVEVKPKR